MRAVFSFFAASLFCLAALCLFINTTLDPSDYDDHLFDTKTRREWSFSKVAKRVEVFGWGALWMGVGFFVLVGVLDSEEREERRKDREALNKEKQKTD